MIRRASLEDIDRISELLLQVHKVHSDGREDLFVKGSKKYTKSELEELLQNENKPIFVYENEQVIEGYVFTIIQKVNNPSLCQIKTLYIDDLCVDKLSRGKGVGTSLYNFIKEYAKSIGCYNITLNVWAFNKNAYEFYKKCGLKEQKIVMEDILEK
ncbi:MAG: GNAT family N-acetyltransferase [Bacilli bacterium]